MKSLSLFAALALLFASSHAHAFEMLGLVTNNGSLFSPSAPNQVDTSGGIGYAFFGRLEMGPGSIESGFLYSQASITTRQSYGDVKNQAGYWILPVLYRYQFLPPFFSIAAGPDIAILGSNKVSVDQTLYTVPTSGFKTNFGAEVSLEATQDLGENLSAVLDARYRKGFGNAITVSGVGITYNSYVIALGLQKRLE